MKIKIYIILNLQAIHKITSIQ